MRLLLDEHLPTGLSAELRGHVIDTVSGRGWAGIKNGELLRRMSGQYDDLVTMDRGIEFQHRISTLPFGIVLVRAVSNRMQDLKPLVPSILLAVDAVKPRRILIELNRRSRASGNPEQGTRRMSLGPRLLGDDRGAARSETASIEADQQPHRSYSKYFCTSGGRGSSKLSPM
jgi:hypothetical protein